MPCIEGPKMNWTVIDGLYHGFLNWHLKCENILDVSLPCYQKEPMQESDCLENLTTDELTLDTIWEKLEEFCKPQLNEVRARFDLLTCFWEGNKSVDEWYNTVQMKVALARYPPETAKMLHRDIFWFLLKDEEFISKTIINSKIYLFRFLQARSSSLQRRWRVLR